MVAHTWIMSARRVWYEAHREAVVVVVRFLTFTIPMAGYVLSGAWEVSRANLVVSRLLWGLLSTVGWHVDNLMSLVLQLTIFVMLRMGLALKVLVHDDNEIWRCSPLGGGRTDAGAPTFGSSWLYITAASRVLSA